MMTRPKCFTKRLVQAARRATSAEVQEMKCNPVHISLRILPLQTI